MSNSGIPTKMKGVVVDKAGGEYKLVHDLDVPKPGPGQILVQSLVTAINPVEGYMQQSGLLVVSWPIVLGCDGSGIVVECGEGVTKFKHQDGVFGCTRLGHPGYSTFQEYFLMDEHLAFKRPKSWKGKEDAAKLCATVGVGLLTACLGLITGTKIDLTAKPCNDNSKWVVILGATGAVGQFAVQVAKFCGFKVIASCSPSNDELAKSYGADATFSYKLSLEDQIKEIGRVTDGKFSRVFDASAVATETGLGALAAYTDPNDNMKIFATVNDWTPIEEKEGIKVYVVNLGLIGRASDPDAIKVNKEIAAFIPVLENCLERGEIKPLAYIMANEGNIGLESVLKGIEEFNTKKSDGRKLVVAIAAN